MKNAKIALVFHVFFDVTTMRDRNEFSRAAATEAGDGVGELLSMELNSLAQRLAALRHSPAELYGRHAPSSAAPDRSAYEPRTKTLPPGARFKRGRPRSAGSTQKAPPPAVRA